MRGCWVGLGVTLVVLWAACVPPCPRTLVDRPLNFAPVANRSRLVFVMSRPPPPNTCAVVIAETGDLIGALAGTEYFVATVDPGWHRYVVRVQGYAPDVVEGDLGPGRVYYALLEWRGWGSYGGIASTILAPRSRDARWSHLTEWMSTARPAELDPRRAAEVVRGIDLARLTADADARVGSFDELQRDEHTWLVEDGWARE